ncbi:hypothetical protein FDI24_gp028 [Acidovorax phage ACP17]|uniref:Uncharacterized protein n=1 Tax=Acidovorax phage ACP17 TaxID=2010329 RepID=A0A218M3D5_9CAUD|nr:hypothetical protein FDI24_gp028 [Acidovorax phage ACP17]ASD50562.1 hypothetical protein [Acidovorax phage ACP17]
MNVTKAHVLRAIELLEAETERFCCHALTAALANAERYHDAPYSYDQMAEEFLHPLLRADEIDVRGAWDSPPDSRNRYPLSRVEWMQKIADSMP